MERGGELLRRIEAEILPLHFAKIRPEHAPVVVVDACRAIVRSGAKPDEVDDAMLASHLYTAGQPDPDLLIRTSGELRVSNFLLWQIAYAEIWVTETRWPDFRRRHLFQALLDYQRRERRYGGLGETNDPAAVLRG